MTAYKKEALLTVGFFVAYLLMAHTAPWAIILGIDNSIRMFGFPLHYLLAVVLGWFGVLAVSILWNYCADRLEEEIAAGGEERSPVSPEESSAGTAGVSEGAAKEGLATFKRAAP